jgi:DNA-binding response OmpR family regulator
MSFILMTAFGDETWRARELGAVLFDKPLDLDDLRTAVSCLLRRAAQTGGRSAPIARGT